MTTLVSKVQHKIFEVGEFVDEQQRNYDQTIGLIENFPWETERKNLVVSLTNPSITIEGRNNDFLKLALFYNGKFVLHYFNKSRELFTKSFTNIHDSYRYIKCFFDEESFNAADFRKENTWLQHNLQHFVSQGFRYTVNKTRIKKFLMATSGFNLGASLFMVGMMTATAFNAGTNANYYGPAIIVLLFIFFVGGGLNLIIFFNFYRNVKNKVLIMSRGNDIFYYGDIDHPEEYNKSEIVRFSTIKIRASRSPINDFAIVAIELKNGNELQIPNLLVDYVSLEQKLWTIPHVEINKMPLIRN